MVTHPAHAFHVHVPALVPSVVACVGDPFYKITSEALLVTQQLVKVGVRSTKRKSFSTFRGYLIPEQ